MIRTEGQDLSAIFSAPEIRRNLKLRELAFALMEAIVFGWPGQDRFGRHLISQSRNGPNSVGLYLADGRSYHFRYRHGPLEIEVLDSYQHGLEVATIRKVGDARKFVDKIKPQRQKVVAS